MFDILFPKRVEQGASIGFFAPSDPIFPRRFQFLSLGIDLLKKWGFSPEIIENDLLNNWASLRTTQERTEEFHRKLTDCNFDILMAVWGGKNSSDLLPYLDYDLIRRTNKPIIGTSDIAVILNAITDKSRVITFHGPNVLGKLNQTKEEGLPFNNSSLKKIKQLLPYKEDKDIRVIQPGQAVGRLVGGSLGTFTLGLSGTKYIPSFKKIIFFFESASLDYFKTRQHLQHLKLTGFTKNVVGVVIGTMTKIQKDHLKFFSDSLSGHFGASIPILWANVFGHGFYHNPTFPIGMKVRLNTGLENKIQPDDDSYRSLK